MIKTKYILISTNAFKIEAENIVNIEKTSSFGFVRGVNAEYINISCKCIDLLFEESSSDYFYDNIINEIINVLIV